MYSRGVNRGLAFTKPGLYCFGFILAVGMIAVATGINGLYIFLSAGLGGFIVSGLLSERAMKSLRLKHTAAAVVDADSSFEMNFNLENRSPWFTLYAVQTFFFLKKPPLRLISKPLPHLAAHSTGRIDPKTILTCKTESRALPRGSYQQLISMQQTTFPFGMLEKYKFEVIDVGLIVTPAVDRKFLQEMRALVRKHLSKSDEDKEFYTHRIYTSQDSLRHLDWKRSAGRKASDWVIKVFNSSNITQTIIVESPWAAAIQCKDEAAYEHWLTRIRTACLAIAETGREVTLCLSDYVYARGYQQALVSLAQVPHYANRARINELKPETSRGFNVLMRLIVDDKGARWQE